MKVYNEPKVNYCILKKNSNYKTHFAKLKNASLILVKIKFKPNQAQIPLQIQM